MLERGRKFRGRIMADFSSNIGRLHCYIAQDVGLTLGSEVCENRAAKTISRHHDANSAEFGTRLGVMLAIPSAQCLLRQSPGGYFGRAQLNGDLIAVLASDGLACSENSGTINRKRRGHDWKLAGDRRISGRVYRTLADAYSPPYRRHTRSSAPDHGD
jgi:hypothetical protein